MSFLLKITLSILIVLYINGCVGLGIWLNVRHYMYPFAFKRAKYAIVSMILMAIAICYIPFMFIWHLY